MIAPMNDVDKALFCTLLSYHRTVRFKGIKRVINGERVAMVGFDDFTHNAVQLHVWTNNSRRALTREFLRECFTYAFITCNLGVALVTVPTYNTAVLKLIKKLGFRQILTIKDGYALGTDLAIQEMRREACRWLDQRVLNGREEQRAGRT